MLQLPGCRYIMIHPYVAWFGMIHPLSKPFTLRTLLRQFGIMSILKWRTRYESVWSREDKLLSRYLDLGSGNKNTKNMLVRPTCPTLFMPSLLEPIDLHVFFAMTGIQMHTCTRISHTVGHIYPYLSYTFKYDDSSKSPSFHVQMSSTKSRDWQTPWEPILVQRNFASFLWPSPAHPTNKLNSLRPTLTSVDPNI